MGSVSMPPPLWSSNDIRQSPSLNGTIQLPTFKSHSMDTESVCSGYSERSRPRPRNHISHGGVHHSESSNILQTSNMSCYNDFTSPPPRLLNHASPHINHARSTSRHSHRSTRAERSYFGEGIIGKRESSPVTSGRHDRRRITTNATNMETIEVHILPQDDTWADNTTAVTGNTSDHSVSVDVDLNKLGKTGLWSEQSLAARCQMWSGPLSVGFLSICAFLSPLVMIILPKIEALEWKVKECGPECDGQLISFLFKLVILVICSWAIFFRPPRATLPRIYIYRAMIMALLVFLMIAYWVFYAERIYERRFNDYELTYYSVVQFSVPFVDSLLWIHYAAVILIQLKQMQPIFIIKVVRSPDGEAHSYNIGELSIQRAALWVLEKYYQDFSIYNPYLDLLPRKNRNKLTTATASRSGHNGSIGGHNHITNGTSTLKYYDVDGVTNNHTNGLSGALLGPGPTSTLQSINSSRVAFGANEAIVGDDMINNLEECGSRRGGGRGAGGAPSSSHHHHHHHHNERFYEEHDYERRVRKRKARLLTAAEEAFTHIKRIRADEPCPLAAPIDPKEAAQAIFPAMARSLQKFLRITRQQPRHTVESIIDHLSLCLTFDLSPKAFLEKYFNTSPVLQNDLEKKPLQTWGLVSDILLTRTIESGTVFMLRQNDISLLVTIQSLPHFNITEEIIDPKCNKFVFKMNSETSV